MAEPNAPPSILLFGATAITGFTLANLFPQTISPFVPPKSKSSWPTLHLEETAWLKALFIERAPSLLIYCHAVCDVSKCEAAPDWAREMNVCHIRRLLDTLPPTTRLVYLSSDHVFGGNGAYDENSPPCPISVYGQTRVEAEELIIKRNNALVLRIGLAIGPSLNGRTGHSDWLAYRHQRQLPITIIEDEFRSVVWASDLARRIMALAHSDEIGLRHITATRAVSRVELAEYMADYLSIDPVLKFASRHQQAAPHLGHVELASLYRGALYQPLPSVVD